MYGCHVFGVLSWLAHIFPLRNFRTKESPSFARLSHQINHEIVHGGQFGNLLITKYTLASHESFFRHSNELLGCLVKLVVIEERYRRRIVVAVLCPH